jgi:acyl carrier protein
MFENKSQSLYPEKEILDGLIMILMDMTSDWEMGFHESSGNLIGPATRLSADLEFTSINMVQLVVAIEKHFRREELPFHLLFISDGRKTDDITVADLVDFIYIHLNNSP